MKNSLHTLTLSLLIMGLMGCAGSGQLTDGSNTRTYNENIQIINNYFLQLIRNSSTLLIENAAEKSKNKMYIISKRVGVNSSTAQSDNSARINIIFVNKNKTTIEIESPEYPFGYPQFKKIDYQRIIFNGLEEMLEQI